MCVLPHNIQYRMSGSIASPGSVDAASSNCGETKDSNISLYHQRWHPSILTSVLSEVLLEGSSSTGLPQALLILYVSMCACVCVITYLSPSKNFHAVSTFVLSLLHIHSQKSTNWLAWSTECRPYTRHHHCKSIFTLCTQLHIIVNCCMSGERWWILLWWEKRNQLHSHIC